MPMTRAQLLYLIANKADNDWHNISHISATTHYPIYFDEYKPENGKGIDFVDIDLGDGEYLTGFFTYNLLPVATRTIPNQKVEIYIDVSEIIRVGFKRTEPPAYALPE